MKLSKCIKWNKYPENMPKESGKFLVTMIVDGSRFAINDVSYSKKYDLWCAWDDSEIPEGKSVPNDHGFTKDVVAWAECVEVVPYAG